MHPWPLLEYRESKCCCTVNDLTFHLILSYNTLWLTSSWVSAPLIPMPHRSVSAMFLSITLTDSTTPSIWLVIFYSMCLSDTNSPICFLTSSLKHLWSSGRSLFNSILRVSIPEITAVLTASWIVTRHFFFFMASVSWGFTVYNLFIHVLCGNYILCLTLFFFL